MIFSRWCQVMLRFEKALYDNPEQDLNRVWWDLVEKYQEVKRPEGRNPPDYASKIHIATVPVYYQNYMLGQLFNSPVLYNLRRLKFQPLYLAKVRGVAKIRSVSWCSAW